MKEDKLEVEILEDGTIKISTDKVSAANHMNAEQLLRNIAQLAGGKTTRKHKHGAKGHYHEHTHAEGIHHKH